MIIPYILAGTNLTIEAMVSMPETIRGWEVIEFTSEVLQQLGVHYGPRDGISDAHFRSLFEQQDIVRLAFMGNDPEACAGYVVDTTFLHGRDNTLSETERKGRNLADMLCRQFLRRQTSTYLGSWACQARSWSDFRQPREWK